MPPELYLDSAVLSEVEKAHSTGRLSGLTINPSLALKAIGPDGDYSRHVSRIHEIVGSDCHKSYQVTGRTSEEMLHAADKLIQAFEQYGGLGIKVPVLTATPDEKHIAREGLRTVKVLADQGVLVNVTTVQRPEHVVLAAYLGARLISPFLGRTDDLIRTNMGLRPDIDFKKSDYFPHFGFTYYNDGYDNSSGVEMMARGAHALRYLTDHKSKILAASVRNTRQAKEAHANGADIVTLPFNVFMETADSAFDWPIKMVSQFLDIKSETVNLWLDTYEHGTNEELYSLLYHPKTVEGYLNFEKDGERLASFRKLVEK